MFVKEGLGKVVAAYGARIQTQYGSRFHQYLNTAVESIHYTDDAVKVITKGGQHKNYGRCLYRHGISWRTCSR